MLSLTFVVVVVVVLPDPFNSRNKSPSKMPPSSDSASSTYPKSTTSIERGSTDPSPVSNTGSDNDATNESTEPPRPDLDAVAVPNSDDASEDSSMGDDWVNLSNTTHPLVTSND